MHNAVRKLFFTEVTRIIRNAKVYKQQRLLKTLFKKEIYSFFKLINVHTYIYSELFSLIGIKIGIV